MAMDLIPILLGSLPLAHNAQNSLVYLYLCRTSCPKSSTCFFFSGISIFRNLCIMYDVYVYVRTYNYSYAMRYAMRHGIVLSAMTLNSSAMDSSAIGVGVPVLVGKCMQGP